MITKKNISCSFVCVAVLSFLVGVIMTWFLKARLSSYLLGGGGGSNLTKTEMIKKLVRQTARWSMAAQQDENPLIAVLHANYGAAYLWALKDITSDDEIRQTTGLDLETLTKETVKIQDAATIKAVKECPSFSSATGYLAKLAGENV